MMGAMSSRTLGYRGPMPPADFNMARYCLGPGEPRDPQRQALVVVSDPQAPPESAERWSYAELDAAVRAIAAGLHDLGLRAGDRMMLRFGNTSDYPLLFFGAIAAGVVALPSSAQLTEEEVSFLLADSGAAVLAMADELRITVPAGVQVVTPEQVREWRTGSQRADYAQTAADDPAFLVYTSGTTGRPKGVLHAHRSAWGRRPMYQGWYDIGRDDVMLHAGAFNWTYTLGVGLTDPWANGAGAVIYNGAKNPGIWPKLLQDHAATLFAAVPGVFRQILKYGEVESFDLSALRHCLVAGEALSPTLLQQWRERVGTELYEALGMSECSTFVSSSPSVPTRPGSPGRPQPERCVAVLPAQPEPGPGQAPGGWPAPGTQPLPVGTPGILAVHRSDPGLMLGYWRRPQEEAEAYRGDWFLAGDLVHLEEDGYLIYHGRTDDVMNVGGYRVSPLEVEACLAGHPTIADVAVTELPVREGVSVIAAFVVVHDPDDPDSFDGSGIMAHAAEHLAGYKRPREVIFVDALPRTANGKVIRADLAARGWSGPEESADR